MAGLRAQPRLAPLVSWSAGTAGGGAAAAAGHLAAEAAAGAAAAAGGAAPRGRVFPGRRGIGGSGGGGSVVRWFGGSVGRMISLFFFLGGEGGTPNEVGNKKYVLQMKMTPPNEE